MSDCDRTSRRNAKTKTWLSCSPSLMLTLSAGRRRKRSSLHSKKELWVFSNRTFQLSLGLLSAWFHLVYFQVLHSCQYPKLTACVHILDFAMVCLLRSSLCAWFSGEASGWKSRAAEDSCWEGQGATGQTRGTTPQHGQKHTGQVTKSIHTFTNTSVLCWSSGGELTLWWISRKWSYPSTRFCPTTVKSRLHRLTSRSMFFSRIAVLFQFLPFFF